MRNTLKITGAVIALALLGTLGGCATMTPEQNEAVAQGITAGLAGAAIIYNETHPVYYTYPQPRMYCYPAVVGDPYSGYYCQ